LDEMAKSKPREGTHGMALVRMLHLELKVYVLQKLTGFAHWRCPGLDANAMYIDIHYTYIIHTYTRAYTAADISIEGTRAHTGDMTSTDKTCELIGNIDNHRKKRVKPARIACQKSTHSQTQWPNL
jgi:hypothetical protein